MSDMADVRQRLTTIRPNANSAGDAPNVVDSNENVKPQSGFGLLLKLALISIVIVPPLVVIILYLLTPAQSVPDAYSLPDPPSLVGTLKLNSHLLQAEKLYEGKIHGPESIVHDHGHFYTGTSDGQILHIYKGEITTIARLGQPPCGGYANEPTCGRPLGMRLDADGYLIVCDAYLGLHKINVASRDVHLLLPSGVRINGRKLHLLNDLDISEDGNIFMTDSSKYQRRDFMLDLLDGRGTGRFLKYDPITNSTEVLVDGLHFANGVQLSRYEDFVLVAESARARILRYHLKGLNAGRHDVFADNLPCLPDNIRRSSRGGYWVGCGLARYEGNGLNLLDVLGPRPWLRWIISKIPQHIAMQFVKPSSILIELDSSGSIVRSLMDLSGENVRLSSEVEDDAGTLYIGSFQESYIARIDTHKLPSDS